MRFFKWLALAAVLLFTMIAVGSLARPAGASEIIGTPVPPLDPGCGTIDPYKGLAWAYYGYQDDYKSLCLPSNFKWHNWGPNILSGYPGKQIPFVWGPGHLDTYCSNFGSNYTGWVLFANEPTNTDQAYMTARQTARLAADIHACTPLAKMVGPNHHPQIAWHPNWMTDFYYYLKAFSHDGKTGIAANGFHIYYHSSMPGQTPRQMINTYYSLLPYPLNTLKLWITEIGYRTSWSADDYDSALWTFEDAASHWRVTYWMGYTTREQNGASCFLSWGGGLTQVGGAFKTAGSDFNGNDPIWRKIYKPNCN